MSPSEHYAAASSLLTRGLDSLAKTCAPDGVPIEAVAHVIDRARVHAMLAAIPQPQYDAWKAERESPVAPPQPRLPYREIGYDGPACTHGRTPMRCSYCHNGTPMRLVCDRCGTGSWWPHRLHGSRCDLTGCAGRLVKPGYCVSFFSGTGDAVQCTRPDFHEGRHHSMQTNDSWP